jgi:hypothetical protein
MNEALVTAVGKRRKRSMVLERFGWIADST